MLQQFGGQFFLSDEKIKEYTKAGLSAESYSARRYKELTDFILENSTIKKFSKMTTDRSAFGLVYQLTLNDGVQSPFVKLNIDDTTPDHSQSKSGATCALDGFNKAACMKPIRTFLLKLSILDNIGQTTLLRLPGNMKLTVAEKEFAEEADLQNHIYEDTYEMGESIAPACIFPSYIDNIQATPQSYNKILNILVKPDIDNDFYLRTMLKEAVKKNINRFGIIIMEFADGYKTLTEILSDRNADFTTKNKAMIQAKIAHLKLYESGYTHGDCHASNIMINLDYVGFMTPPNTGKALLIDFGRTTRIPPADIFLRKLPKKIGPENYQAVLEYSSWVSNLRGKVAHPPYDWIKIPVFKTEEMVMQQILNSIEANVFRKLGKIKGAIPSELSRDSIFVKFLEHPSFSNFETLRWREIAMAERFPRHGFIAPVPAAPAAVAPVAPAAAAQPNLRSRAQSPVPNERPYVAKAPAANLRSRAQSPVPSEKPAIAPALPQPAPAPAPLFRPIAVAAPVAAPVAAAPVAAAPALPKAALPQPALPALPKPALPQPALPKPAPAPAPAPQAQISPKIQRQTELPKPQPRNRDFATAAAAASIRRKPVIPTKAPGDRLSITNLYPQLPNAPVVQETAGATNSVPVLIPKQQLANLCTRMADERRKRTEKTQKAGKKTRRTVKAVKAVKAVRRK